MNRFIFCIAILLICQTAESQSTGAQTTLKQGAVQRPKLIIGFVVDQMRWDYLYRYYDRYAEDGGFKTLINHGFSCDNTFIPYTPTVTACGHATIFTGSVPAIHGITGNQWWDYKTSQMVYCTGDNTEKTVGSTTPSGQMSPRNLLVTTIGDEIRLSNNFRSKVFGIAIKDRGAILTVGLSANGAFWFDDKTGDWITSTYYMNALPAWLQELNAKKLPEKYFALDWNTLYPIDTYVQSTPDTEPYEFNPFGGKGFPYKLSDYIVGKNYGFLPVTPYGNTVTLDVAKAAIEGEHLGAGNLTDFLAISLSTPDYIGHSFGPNSVEAEDGFLRLDKDLGDFLRYLDKQVGAGNYLVVLSADHGVAQIPSFMKEHKIAAGSVDVAAIMDQLNSLLKDKFRTEKLVLAIANHEVFLDRSKMISERLNKALVYNEAISFLMKQPGIYNAIALDAVSESTLHDEIKKVLINGDYPSRSGDIQLIFQSQWIEGFDTKGTTHGVWNRYDSHIPLLWYGWNIQPGKTNRETCMTDIAPTIAALLHVQMPSGSVGHPIEEIVK